MAITDSRPLLLLIVLGVIAFIACQMLAQPQVPQIVIPVTNDTAIDHAEVKHNTQPQMVDQCLNNNGPDLTYEKVGEVNGDKRVDLCLLPEGLGIRVTACKFGVWCRITSYIDQNIRTIEDAVTYAEIDKGQYGYWTYLKDCWKAVFPEIMY